MRRTTASACALLLAFALPLTAIAGRPGGGGGGGRPGGGGGGGRPGGAPAAPAMRPQMPQPAARPAGPAPGSFNFNRDIAPAPQARPAPIARPAAPVSRPAPAVQRPAVTQRAVPAGRPATAQRPAAEQHAAASRPTTQHRTASAGGGQHVAYRRAPVSQSATGGQFRGHFHGSPVRNPRAPHGNWGWNHGRPWQPANIYWGGGFWGPFALASIASFGLFGAIEDSQDGYAYDSYRVEPDTPGADLLNDYGLEQVACGPPGLVDIWGPDGSIVCAQPNDSVAPGDYEVDPQTFTLIPATN